MKKEPQLFIFLVSLQSFSIFCPLKMFRFGWCNTTSALFFLMAITTSSLSLAVWKLTMHEAMYLRPSGVS